jgi:enamine deaminase RidA (YjgF/YER057c/UK114 family)
MKRREINPWTWQEQFGFVHANEITSFERMLVVAGQVSTDDDGRTMHPGDMAAQMNQSLDNLETILRDAEMTLENVVRLNYFTTDVDVWLESTQHWGGRLAEAGCRPASTLLGVTRLAFPDLLVEIEAIAVA